MTYQTFANAARAELAADITAEDTTITITEGGELFPIADVGDVDIEDPGFLFWFKLVLQDEDGYEIVYVRAHDEGSNTFSDVLRGQEDTEARAFEAVHSTSGRRTIVGLRPTAWDYGEFTGAAKGLQEHLEAVNPHYIDADMLGLADVATSGSYNDLTGKPDLADVATSGDYSDLTGTPGNATTSAAGLMSAADKSKLDGVASGATANDTDANLKNRANHTGTQAASTITGLADVATSGSYSDLSGVPSNATTSVAGLMSAADKSKLDGVASGATANDTDANLKNRANHTGTQAASTITGLADVATSGSYNDLDDKPALADVATSGSYADLDDTPSNATTSAAGFMSAADKTKLDGLAGVATSGSYNDLTDKPTIPQGTVTSVGLSAPTGFQVSGSPVTASGTLALAFASGYSLPTTAKQGQWDTAYGWGNHASAGYAPAANPTFTGTVTLPATTGADTTLSRVMLKDTGVAYYNSGTTSTLNYTNGSHQRWAPTDDAELSITNWPPSGNLGELLIEGVSLGEVGITWPEINWVLADGLTSTDFADTEVELGTDGAVDWILLWTRDAGTTIYGKVMR